MVRLDREELAWAAGFFDGEGSTGAYGPHHAYPRCQVAQAVDDPARPEIVPVTLQRFQRAVGGLGYFSCAITSPAASARAQYKWHAWSFEHMQAVVAMLWAFLSPMKRAQMRKALKAYHGYTGSRRRPIPKALCCISGCDRPHVARGWCSTHYARWRKHGAPA